MRNISYLLRNMSFFRHGDREITFSWYAIGGFPRQSVSTKTHRVNYHKCLFYWLLITTYSSFNKIFFVFCMKFGITNYPTRRMKQGKQYRLIGETIHVFTNGYSYWIFLIMCIRLSDYNLHFLKQSIKSSVIDRKSL